MRYWVYINDKVEGPYEEDKLVTLQGFTPDTLICSEEVPAGGNQEWVKASSVFEFDKVEQPDEQPMPAEEVFRTQRTDSTSAVNSDVSHVLLDKIDFLTREISGLQAKLDDMKTKLDTAISSARYAGQAGSDVPAYIPPQDDAHNTITLTRHNEAPVNEEAAITDTASLVSQAENIVAAANQEEKPLDMLGPIDLGDKKNDSTPTEVSLGSKAEEEVVLRSALDSLYNAQTIQSQEEKESTFQDLLTPKQAEALAAQADAHKAQESADKKPTLDEALKAVQEQDAAAAAEPTAHEAEKDALLKELTSEPKEDVLDQVIKEKEAEKQAETRRLEEAAAAGAAAGIAAVGLHELNEEPNQAQPAPGFETVAEASAEPVPEKQTLDFTNPQDAPSLSIAPDRHEPEKQEEVKPASEMPADVQPAPADKPHHNPDIELPSLDEADNKKKSVAAAEQDEKEETFQELVPGAKTEKPEGVIITDEDLNEAFNERKAEPAQSVEQMFGLAPENNEEPAQQPQAEQAQPEATAEPVAAQPAPQTDDRPLPQFSDQTADKPLPMGNPNDLTEIELKEGSTYLISDFVPPAQANGNELPKELNQTNQAAGTQTADMQEMVDPVKQTEKQAQPAADAPKDVTVSQIILENTIKTKRGATLDIKTVPMVPEPAQSERLHLDNMDDDINTQHDMKSADAKAPVKTTKMVMGILIALVLAAGIYVMLAFMELIPPQFNLLSSGKTAAAAQEEEQNASLGELLGTAQPQAAQAAAPNPMDTALAEVKNFPLANGYTLQQYIEAKHPAAKGLITWEISTAVDPDNYSVLVKVPPENPQSFKISYRFNYNTVTKALDPTISDAKNLLDSVQATAGQQPMAQPQQPAAPVAQTQPIQQAAPQR